MSMETEVPLAELFLKDPEDLSDADFDRIIAKLREERQGWLKAEAAGATKSFRGTTSKKVAAAPTLSLDDLDL